MAKDKKDDILNQIKSGEHEFKIDESSYKLPLEVKAFDSIQNYKRFIKGLERVIRTSPEYRNWLAYLKNELHVDQCLLTHEVASEVSIEIHHHPISLYNLCCIVVDTLMHHKGKTTSLEAATIVLGLHFSGKVGYIPLVKTLHEKFHNGYLKIPIDLVRGDWQFILDNFVIAPEISIVVNKYINIGKEALLNVTWQKDNYDGIKQLGLDEKQDSDNSKEGEDK